MPNEIIITFDPSFFWKDIADDEKKNALKSLTDELHVTRAELLVQCGRILQDENFEFSTDDLGRIESEGSRGGYNFISPDRTLAGCHAGLERIGIAQRKTRDLIILLSTQGKGALRFTLGPGLGLFISSATGKIVNFESQVELQSLPDTQNPTTTRLIINYAISHYYLDENLR